MRRLNELVFLSSLVMILSCSGEDISTPALRLIAVTADGVEIQDFATNINTEITFRLVFSAAVDITALQEYLLVESDAFVPSFTLSSSNAGTAVVFVLSSLDENAEYRIVIPPGSVLGSSGEVLSSGLDIRFITRGPELITEYVPCTTANDFCKYSMDMLTEDGLKRTFSYYASYPVGSNQYELADIKGAIVLMHGQNRDSDAYFNDMIAVLRSEGLDDQLVLIAPSFEKSGTAEENELYWDGNGWREGQYSSEAGVAIHSFQVLDSLLSILVSGSTFPNLETILLTGHSSGATFCYLYSGTEYYSSILGTAIEIQTGVANSQYFYYPQDLRWSEALNEYVTPSSCTTYRQWPYGYEDRPDALGQTTRQEYNENLVQASVSYILGTADVITTGTLNTSDCGAVLLGEHRYDRGLKIFEFYNRSYPGEHRHELIEVPGIGHNSTEIYSSSEFRIYLKSVLNK